MLQAILRKSPKQATEHYEHWKLNMQDVKIERHHPDPRWVCVTQNEPKSSTLDSRDGRSKMDIMMMPATKWAYIKFSIMESLILAQDERWRRA